MIWRYVGYMDCALEHVDDTSQTRGGARGLIPDIGMIEWVLRERKGSRWDVDDNRFGGSCIAMQGTVGVAYALIIEQDVSL